MTDQIAQTFDNPGTVPTGSTEQWRDKKRYLWLIGLVVPSLAFVGFGAVGRDRVGGCGSGSARSSSWSSSPPST